MIKLARCNWKVEYGHYLLQPRERLTCFKAIGKAFADTLVCSLRLSNASQCQGRFETKYRRWVRIKSPGLIEGTMAVVRKVTQVLPRKR
jgi:hypothetical protein